jgi:glycosyltransferase involved in cell wall biosynthesis
MSPRLAVDIVIDNYNYGRFLAAAIDSALAQRDPEAHVIVVDDGSSDDSREVIGRYGGRIAAVLKDNGGQASAFNAGWAHCRGDAVIFLDADDVLLPGATSRIAGAFAASPGVVKVQYRMAVIDQAGRPTGTLMPAAHVRMPSGDVRRSELTFPFDLPWMATSGNAFSAAALRRIMPIPEDEFATSADWYLRHLIALLGDVVSLREVCASYRVHGSNGYALSAPALDLEHIRQTVRYAAATRRHLERLAGELGLPAAPGPILSVADLANRVVSLKLDRDAHPLRDDRVKRLTLAGAGAALRRFDVRWPMKLLFIGWFFAMALAPRRVARTLAELFLFPERRMPINSVLGRLSRPIRRLPEGVET